jgi:hypothetical protein
MGLSSTHIKDPARRDRLLMLAAFAQCCRAPISVEI